MAQGDDKAVLEVGKTNWQLPIPIVKTAGGWVFDTRAGADEMVTRRIGRNELSAMEAALAYFDAQKEYARKERQPGMGLVYAQKLRSTPGKQDGLYWDTAPGEAPSPIGPSFAATSADGAYHGYFYRILTGQGKNAPGGAYDYRIKGRMSAGLRAHRLAGTVRAERHHELHGQPRRRGLPEEPRAGRRCRRRAPCSASTPARAGSRCRRRRNWRPRSATK